MPNIYIRKRNETVWFILDNAPLNSLTFEMIDQLGASLHVIAQQEQPPRLVVLSGAGEQAFCAGVDIPDDAEEARTQLLRVATTVCSAFKELHTRHITTVALVKGHAFGAGCELAAMCDVIIAREDARFRLPAANARVFHDAIATYLPEAIGQETTTRLMQSGETQDARQAMRLGFVHQVLSTHSFLSDTEELLVMLASIAV